jgi:hypothetical protein
LQVAAAYTKSTIFGVGSTQPRVRAISCAVRFAMGTRTKSSSLPTAR